MKLLHKLVVVSTALCGFPSLLYFKNDNINRSRNERYVWFKDFTPELPPLSIQKTYDTPKENSHSHFQKLPNQVEYQVLSTTNKTLYRIDPSVLAKARVIYNFRQSIRTDLKGFDIDWQKSHIPEFGGKPIRNIIISTWRSGSTFFAELVSSHPGTLLIFEPFMHLESERIRTRGEIPNAIKMSKSIFDCQFNYTEWTRNSGDFIFGMISRSDKMKPFCANVPDGCRDPRFISKLCKAFPIQLIKFVRFRLKDAEELLSDEKYDTRLAYLVRDPRGTMKSRNNGSNYWCDHHPDCSDERRLCADLVDEFADAKILREKYPTRFKVLRYEDVSLNVELAAKTMLPFFRLSYHSKVKHFVTLHSRITRKDEFGTYRNSKKTVFSWLNYFLNDVTRLDRIQNYCKEAMDLWGYKPLDINQFKAEGENYQGNYTLKELVLDRPPWEDMNLS
ncbi:carbohydrate sulfotransferase 6-like [Folsomia candida]|uniref:carbohydrate sulfotransferase 6-like n=1 Tax=Folsomia candida TaxID=158441 RepID=UPI001604C97D|nr:carbohydrate sulfotransferase 6-like [Folsomia candida]